MIDRELAHGLNLLDGTDQSGGLPTIPIDQTTERAKNQIEAFKQVYGREPVTANDWRMAAGLDPHSYTPKNLGVPPEIVAGRFPPELGKGVVRTNLFIPANWVMNGPRDVNDIPSLQLAHPNWGDNRGPSAAADPEASRVSVFVDYDNGLIVVRQNPSSMMDTGGRAKTAPPQVHVVRAPDGRMTIDYNAWDPYEAAPAVAANATVHGRITLDPQDNGSVALGGTTTIYPSMETYQYRSGIPPETLQWTPANSGSEWGPGTSLVRSHWVGDATIPAVRPEMPGWKFFKPSLRRVLVCIVAVTLVACVSAGIVLYVVAIVTHNDPAPTPAGDYVRLLLLDLTFWGPIMVITGWPIFVPIILAVGALVATIRVVDPPDDDEASAEADATGAK